MRVDENALVLYIPLLFNCIMTIRSKGGLVPGEQPEKGAAAPGVLSRKEPDVSVQKARRQTSAAALDAVEIVDREAEIKVLLYELYDKVNIDLVFGRADVDEGVRRESVAAKRRMLLVRYILSLLRLGADERTLAKAVVLWHGQKDQASVHEHMRSAGWLKTFQTPEGVTAFVSKLDPFAAFSASAGFRHATKAQWGVVGDSTEKLEYARRNGISKVYGLYQKIHDYVAEDFEHTGSRKWLIERTARELEDLGRSYRGLHGKTDIVPSWVFHEVAAALLYVWKSGYVNVVKDNVVEFVARRVMEGAGKGKFESVLRIMESRD